MSRQNVRNTLYNFLLTPQITSLNQVFTSFPKRINFQINSAPGQLSRAAGVIFIENEVEERIAMGGAHSGWKRIDYSVVLQVFHHSMRNDAEDVMTDFDDLIDNIKARLRSDHNFGDSTGVLVWQGAEPAIDTSYAEPQTSDGGATETFAEIRFKVTEMIQA